MEPYYNQKNDGVVADELTMVKKISSAKDLELDEMKIKVKVFEGKLMCACINS